MAVSNFSSMSPSSLVSKLVEEFSEVINSIRDPEQRSMAVELLNKFPVNNSTCEIYEETMLKMCARIGDIAAGIVHEILKQKLSNLESMGSLLHPSSKRRTALHVAAENGSIGIAKLLLSAGANIECEDSDKRTPLHLAAINKQKEAIILLLDHGAKRTATDLDNQTPMNLLSQPMYNDELSKFKSGEINSDDSFADTTPKKKRSKRTKAKKEEIVETPFLTPPTTSQHSVQAPQQHPANMFYYPAPPQPYQMTNQDQQPIQYIYRIINTPNGQFAQQMPYFPYGQQMNQMGAQTLPPNAIPYGNQQSYIRNQPPIYALNYSANQQQFLQASESASPSPAPKTSSPIPTESPMPNLESQQFYGRISKSPIPIVSMEGQQIHAPNSLNESSNLENPLYGQISKSPIQASIASSNLNSPPSYVENSKSPNLSPISIRSPKKEKVRQKSATPLSTRTFIIKRPEQKEVRARRFVAKEPEVHKTYSFKPANEEPEVHKSFKPTNEEPEIHKTYSFKPANQEVNQGSDQVDYLEQDLNNRDEEKFWSEYGIEGFPFNS